MSDIVSSRRAHVIEYMERLENMKQEIPEGDYIHICKCLQMWYDHWGIVGEDKDYELPRFNKKIIDENGVNLVNVLVKHLGERIPWTEQEIPHCPVVYDGCYYYSVLPTCYGGGKNKGSSHLPDVCPFISGYWWDELYGIATFQAVWRGYKQRKAYTHMKRGVKIQKLLEKIIKNDEKKQKLKQKLKKLKKQMVKLQREKQKLQEQKEKLEVEKWILYEESSSII